MVHTHLKAKQPLSFAISYGFLGGPANGRKTKRLVRRAGLHISDDMARSDIIMAHSAGCVRIAANAKPKLVVYVGMPIATGSPSRIFLQTHGQNIRAFVAGGQLGRGLQIALYSLYYGLRQPRRNRDIIHNSKSAQPVLLPEAQTVFIANRHDPWPRSEQLDRYLADKEWAFISLPGSHDDIWQHPERYTAIINHYARLLAQTNR